ncbi:uncharacterized protein LOC114247432 [Bombyx mandarina]|uniref:Uncharacterized protein LOC114247432 n=1 Tax=Bombyx mandarina TaxID=7092 RepID=A0A6J2K2S0_BOMMA|nr:uncharacterized protein LOC114247432 [Bombyx mandarina]
MYPKIIVLFIILTSIAVFCEGSEEIEARGKKKKIALFVYFADIVIKKIFVLKLIYAFVFWVVLHKAGYFLSWFASYIKEQKHEYHDHHDHHEYAHHDYGPNYGPYRKQSDGYRLR